MAEDRGLRELAQLERRLQQETTEIVNSPHISVVYEFSIPEDVIETVRTQYGQDDAPVRCAKKYAREKFKREYGEVEQFLGEPTMVVEHIESWQDRRSFRVICRTQ